MVRSKLEIDKMINIWIRMVLCSRFKYNCDGAEVYYVNMWIMGRYVPSIFDEFKAAFVSLLGNH